MFTTWPSLMTRVWRSLRTASKRLNYLSFIKSLVAVIVTIIRTAA
jgi:hypothetical protein